MSIGLPEIILATVLVLPVATAGVKPLTEAITDPVGTLFRLGQRIGEGLKPVIDPATTAADAAAKAALEEAARLKEAAEKAIGENAKQLVEAAAAAAELVAKQLEEAAAKVREEAIRAAEEEARRRAGLSKEPTPPTLEALLEKYIPETGPERSQEERTYSYLGYDPSKIEVFYGPEDVSAGRIGLDPAYRFGVMGGLGR